MDKYIEGFIGSCDSYDESKIVLYGVPFDSTTSFRPGTRFASKAIRSESYGIETYSPYLDLDLEDYKFFDSGDLDLPFGNVNRVLDEIEKRAKEILDDNKIPCMIGGEHLSTLGQFRAIYNKYKDIYVIQLDAHTDLREDYIGEKMSHACVIKRIWDIIGDNRIYQFGIRSGLKEEFEFGKKHTFLHKFDLEGFSKAIEELKGKKVYFTLDLDVLDPSIFPGTGTPEAGGVTFMELLNAVKELGKLDIVGFDINELSPVYDQSGVSTAVACKILRELILIIGKDRL